MMYDIRTRSDFLTGLSLIVTIPESELDKKALYTIQSDKPEFILPFSYRSLDGLVEFAYQIGAHSKLQYFSGARSPKEYTLLWSKALTPLLNCGDWFMKPYSFVLSAEYLYYDKNKNSVCYVYIPSTRDCSEHAAIKEMAAEFSKHVSVSDAELENKALRAIIKDFNPKMFLQMLESHITSSTTPPNTYPGAGSVQKPTYAAPGRLQPPAPEFKRDRAQNGQQGADGEIIINIPPGGRPPNVEKGFVAGEKHDRDKKKKESKKSKNTAVTYSPAPQRTPARPQAPAPPDAPAWQNAAAFKPNEDSGNITQNVSVGRSGPRFKLIGSVLLPPGIDVHIPPGGIFTIGRFDTALGRQQSSFEFDRKTKAVSRRHAVIEREADKYKIIDLTSSAGTYINGRRLPPNAPCELGHGCRVSFGNAGADYVWEEYN